MQPYLDLTFSSNWLENNTNAIEGLSWNTQHECFHIHIQTLYFDH